MSQADLAAVFHARRRAVLSQARRGNKQPADAAFITKAADLRYLCGSTEGCTGLYFDRSRAVAFTNTMFVVRVTRECVGCEISMPKKGVHAGLAAVVRQRKRQRIGLREEILTVPQERSLTNALDGTETCDIAKAINGVRALKEEGEIAVMRRAMAIAEDAFRELTGKGAAYFIGKTERHLAAELDYLMRLRGADAMAFATIVASGPNSYNCHHVPGDRVVGPDEPVLFDWGAEVDGYRSDTTRVVFTGGVPEALAPIYQLVLDAHDSAVAKMRPGVRSYTVNEAARGLIDAAGYGKEFRHGLGHGLGLETHEPLGFGKRPTSGTGMILKRGMVLTVEPGVYLEGIGGVRIEDDILVTPVGHERLNTLPRDLASMILA
jgi:Xaa-Pro aminopeptidase